MMSQMADNINNHLLGDSVHRSYAKKLELFNRFAEPELRQIIAGLGLCRGQRILDAGSGVGLTTAWLAEQVVPNGLAIGLELATSHLLEACRLADNSRLPMKFIQGDITHPPFAPATFDGIWCANTINHLRDPLEGVRALLHILRPGGLLVLGQSAFLPDMFFAWDARLEKEVMLACRAYFRKKYGLDERDTTGDRNLFGLMQRAGLCDLKVHTHVIERVAPLKKEDERYFVECVFKGYWGHRLRPFLTDTDWEELQRLCDPQSPDCCLHRPDFHHIQTFTVVAGRK